jgi:hypothetical protein
VKFYVHTVSEITSTWWWSNPSWNTQLSEKRQPLHKCEKFKVGMINDGTLYTKLELIKIHTKS